MASSFGAVQVTELQRWTEAKLGRLAGMTHYVVHYIMGHFFASAEERRISRTFGRPLKGLHKARLIELSSDTMEVHLPPGSKEASRIVAQHPG